MEKKCFTCIGKGHGAPAIPATLEEWQELRRQPWLKEMCRRIENGEEALKSRLPIWTPSCAEFKNNHRAVNDATKPLQRLMLDFDQKGHSKKILDRCMQLKEQGKWDILLVEESVRRGTHVLITMPEGMIAQEIQKRFSADIGFEADPSLKDVARCIYMVTEEHTLYLSNSITDVKVRETENGEVKTESYTYPSALSGTSPSLGEDAGEMSPKVRGTSEAEGVCDTSLNANRSSLVESFPTHYQVTEDGTTYSIPYTDDTTPSPCGRDGEGSALVSVLEEQMGGRPSLGSRNNFIFAMACHLRYVCNDDPNWIAQVLPTYGEDREKWMATIRSACNRNQTKNMPKLVQRTIEICKARQMEQEQQEENPSIPPPMPKLLPPLIKHLISKTPDIYKPAVAHAVFPALGAHLWQTRFRYIDNVEHEATLMNVLMAGTGAGKNCISEPINRIMADIRRRDQENLRREREWKHEVQSKGANKDKRQRPEGLVIQEIDPDMTNAAFVQRLADAGDRFLYTKMNEIDQFDALRSSSNRKGQFQIMCLAFDPGNMYGQTRVGTSSVSERVCIRFNWNASTTVSKGQRYFSQVLTDGPISRINFCTIPEREIGADMPIYGAYDEAYDEELRPYIERLNNARGLIDCPQARSLSRKLIAECADFSRLSQSRVYENLSYRANVIAYLKAMVLYVAQGEKWDKRIEDFIRWSLNYDLWCKMHFFGDDIEYAESLGNRREKGGPQNLLEQLPDVFTREEAQRMRQRMGITKGNASQMLRTWKFRGYIVEVENNSGSTENTCYRKTEEYKRKNNH